MQFQILKDMITGTVVGKILASKHGNLMLPEVFPDKVTPDIDFTDEAVTQPEVAVVKILL